MKKKILIISLSAGAGHVQAGKALEAWIAKDYTDDFVCEHIDMARYITPAFKTTAIDAYGIIATKLPRMWKLLYEMTDNRERLKLYKHLTKYLKHLNSFSLFKKVRDYKPDHIICTHFLAADVLLHAIHEQQPHATVSVVVTDYALHSMWYVPGVSYYFIPTHDIRDVLIQSYAIPKSQIVVSGIPIDPLFYLEAKNDEVSHTYRLPEDRPLALVLSGGNGMIKTGTIIQSFFNQKRAVSIIAVAGNNTDLKNKLKKLNPPPHVYFKILGWTDDMPALIHAADVVISKPGGLTTTECLITGTPIIAVNPIPGQEEANAQFIKKNNLGIIAKAVSVIPTHFFNLLSTQRPVYTSPTAGQTILDTIKILK